MKPVFVRPRPLAGAILVLLCLALPACRPHSPPSLDKIRAQAVLNWGGDEEGGGPYIYRNPENPDRLIGFEIDLMAALAQELGARSEFQQCQWDDLLKLLGNGGVDAVVNGYELTAERLRSNIATIPYYVYELHLFVRQDDPRMRGWETLKAPRPDGSRWRIGVLTSTAADNYLTESFAPSVEVVRYNGTTDAFRDVENKNLDGTLTDTPAAVYYGPKFPVRLGAPPAQSGYYVIYLRPGDESLRDQFDRSLRAMIEDGRLRTILERYRIWNAAQAQLALPEVQRKPEVMRSAVAELRGWDVTRKNFPLLIKAAGVTVLLSLAAMPLAILIGLLTALGRLYGPGFLRILLTLYVEITRGTPLLLQLLFLHYGLVPLIGLPEGVRDYASIISAILGLALNYGAYEAEIYRAGLMAIPIGQTEAALALGLTRRQAIWHVVVPQAMRLVIPPVTNDFINLFKDTAVCSVIAVEELSKRYNIAVNNTPSSFLELALVTGLLYLIMSYPLALLTRKLETTRTMARA